MLITLITAFARRLSAARTRRIAIAELRQMDDLLLQDLGITRDQIEDYVDGMLSAKPRLRVIEGGASSCREEPPLCCAA